MPPSPPHTHTQVGQAGTGDRAMAKLRTGGAYVTICGAMASHVKPGCTQHEFINSDTNLDSYKLLDELTALANKGGLRMPSIPASFPTSKVAEAFALSKTGHVVGKILVETAAPHKEEL